jgi:hypothetical protein
MVAHTMLATFESLANGGSTGTEAEDCLRRLQVAYESPGGPAMVLHSQARNILSGRPVWQPAETLQAVSEIDKNTVSKIAGELLGQAIVTTPRLIPAVRGRMPQFPLWSADTVSGTQFRSRESSETLTVGDQGVMLAIGAGKHVTVRSGAVAALLRWNDGKRTLIGTDGFAVQLDAADWQDGDAALRSVEANVEPGLMVDLDSPGPDRPRQDTQTAQATQPQQPAAMASLRKGRPPLGWRSRIIRSLWFACMIFGILAMLGNDLSGGAGFAAIGLAGLAGQELLIRRRMRQHGDSGRH